MNKYLRFLSFLMIAFFAAMSASAGETAEQVMRKAAEKINSAGGISASFTMVSGQHKISGTLKSSGKKFALETASNSTWYDGRNMWTYSAGSGETMLVVPTAAEVAEANPLALVNSYSSSFTATFAKSQKSGIKTILLTPKSKSLGFKSVHVSLSETTGLPTSIVVIPATGTRISIDITGVKTGQKFAASAFTYPKSKYPKAEIVDLR